MAVSALALPPELLGRLIPARLRAALSLVRARARALTARSHLLLAARDARAQVAADAAALHAAAETHNSCELKLEHTERARAPPPPASAPSC